MSHNTSTIPTPGAAPLRAMADYAMQSLTVLSHIVFYTSWPIVKLVQAIVYVLSPFWAVAQFILLPLTVVAKALLSIVLLPFRLHLLEKIETIYIYLGIASLIGFATGCVLYISFNLLSSTLRIDPATEIETKRRANDRTARSYKTERAKKKVELSPMLTMKREEAIFHRQRGILSQTIIEEDDSDF